MADPLTSLIRLAAAQVDEQRRAVAAVLDRLDGLAGAVRRLDDALAGEQARQRHSADREAFGYGAFAARMRDERQRLATAEAAAAAELAGARAALAEAYRQRRKLEKVKETLLRRDALAARRRERRCEDEVAQAIRLRPKGSTVHCR